MCDLCNNIILQKKFYSPRDYRNCLTYIQSLIESGNYEIVEQTCDFDNVKDSDGNWIGDIISHIIRCKNCGQKFTCFCDTFHGTGTFRTD